MKKPKSAIPPVQRTPMRPQAKIPSIISAKSKQLIRAKNREHRDIVNAYESLMPTFNDINKFTYCFDCERIVIDDFVGCLKKGHIMKPESRFFIFREIMLKNLKK